MEPACLIPMSQGAVQCVMVGDHCQLPPTVVVRCRGSKPELLDLNKSC
jgi:superfamily I DNA and/or RNA helicase